MRTMVSKKQFNPLMQHSQPTSCGSITLLSHFTESGHLQMAITSPKNGLQHSASIINAIEQLPEPEPEPVLVPFSSQCAIDHFQAITIVQNRQTVTLKLSEVLDFIGQIGVSAQHHHLASFGGNNKQLRNRTLLTLLAMTFQYIDWYPCWEFALVIRPGENNNEVTMHGLNRQQVKTTLLVRFNVSENSNQINATVIHTSDADSFVAVQQQFIEINLLSYQLDSFDIGSFLR